MPFFNFQRDHLWSGDHLRLGIICGAVQYYGNISIVNVTYKLCRVVPIVTFKPMVTTQQDTHVSTGK